MKSKRKKYLIISVTILVLAVSMVLLGLYLDQRHKDELYEAMKINFVEERDIEYGSALKTEELVLSHEGGTLSFDKELDPFTLGGQDITFTLEKEGVKRSFVLNIAVADTKGPVIALKSDQLELDNGADFDALANVESVSDPVDGKLEPYPDNKVSEAEGYYYESDVDVNKAGTYEVKIHAFDKNQNETSSTYQVIVKAKVIPSTSPSINYGASGGYGSLGPEDVTSPTYINGILLVNKTHPLPVNYGNGLDNTALNAFYALQAGAKEAGYNIPIISGFRSYSLQKDLYNRYVARDGQALADTYSARPGHSEHQTGLALDVGALDNNYGNTNAGKWLNANCAQYGFILRYPKGKEHITGYQYEPWHIRYVGKDVAVAIMGSGLTLEEYLGAA